LGVFGLCDGPEEGSTCNLANGWQAEDYARAVKALDGGTAEELSFSLAVVTAVRAAATPTGQRHQLAWAHCGAGPTCSPGLVPQHPCLRCCG